MQMQRQAPSSNGWPLKLDSGRSEAAGLRSDHSRPSRRRGWPRRTRDCASFRIPAHADLRVMGVRGDRARQCGQAAAGGCEPAEIQSGTAGDLQLRRDKRRAGPRPWRRGNPPKLSVAGQDANAAALPLLECGVLSFAHAARPQPLCEAAVENALNPAAAGTILDLFVFTPFNPPPWPAEPVIPDQWPEDAQACPAGSL